ncbi:MAG: pantoate--beta-alanine ligase [Chloroflexota bacterium]|nr:pantoate--beta-alanine ligase [Chloroflexota bacterium]
MRVFRTVAEVRSWRRQLAGDLGLVPTMGYLHEGHLSLVRAARAADAHVAVSIFVNPTQFAPGEDLARYPRDEARDLALLEAERADAVFAPSVAEMYPPGYSTWVEVEGLTARLEGASRPAHFRGVTTVVAKLLEIVRPRRAYFGQKDAQQLAVVRRMVRDLDIDVEIVGLPIVREADGLALSSRNVYLQGDDRQAALVLSHALALARRMSDDGVRDANAIRAEMEALIRAEPRASVDYVSIADPDTLDELETIDRPALASLAVRIGGTRLIDNSILGAE